MDFALSSRFIVGALIGAILYHLWVMKQASSKG